MGGLQRYLFRNLQMKVNWFGIQFKCRNFCSNYFNTRSLARNLLTAFYSFGAMVVIFFAVLEIFYVIFLFGIFFLIAIEQLYESADFGQQQNEAVVDYQKYTNYSFGLKLVIPGITVPLSHVFYIWLGGLISLIFHELGHAIAANLKNVEVESFKLCMYAFLIPVASTELDEGDFESVGFISRIQIITAGVYHNIVVCGCGVCLLLLLPTLLAPFYITNQGVYVLNVSVENSVINNEDTVIEINGEKVSNINQFKALICTDYQSNQIEKYSRIMDSHKEQVISGNSSYNYNYIDISSTIGQSLHNDIDNIQPLSYCLSKDVAKNINKSSQIVCSSSEECLQLNLSCFKLQIQDTQGVCIYATSTTIYYVNKVENNSCFNHDILVWPVEQTFGKNNQADRILVVLLLRSYQESNERLIVLTGQQQEVLGGVTLSNYVPRSIIFSVYFPLALEQFLQYLIGISAGVTFINLLPVNCFDGGLLWYEMYFGVRRYLNQKKKRFKFHQ